MDLNVVNEFIPGEEEAIEQGWHIKTDLEADWALDKIREEQAEYRRFEMVVNEKIAQLQMALSKKKDSMESSVSFFRGMLQAYFGKVPHKSTKTQETYSLPSGKLVLKSQKPEFIRDEKTLTAWVEQSAPEFLKINKITDWEGLKEVIKTSGNNAISQDGEVIPGITIKERPKKFEVVVE
jgi:hypothetical protein